MTVPAYRGHTSRAAKLKRAALALFCAALLALSARTLAIGVAHGRIPVPLRGTHLIADVADHPLLFGAVFLVWVILGLCAGAGAYGVAMQFYRGLRD